MIGNSLLLIQGALLLLVLFGVYLALASGNLLKKIMGWGSLQLGITLLWLSVLSRYHDQLNPFPLSIVLVIVITSFGVLSILLILVLGVVKRQGSLETSKISGGKA